MSESHPSPTAEPAPASAEEIRTIKKHMAGYRNIGLLQVFFAMLCVAVSYLVPASLQALATLLVAGINGVLVAGILMHLKEEKRTIWKFLIFTGIFFFVLFFLTYLARTDHIMHTTL